MLLDEMKARFAAQGLIGSGYVVIRGYLPETPDKVIMLKENGGAAPEAFFADESATIEQPTLQCIVRGAPTEYDEPRLQIERLYQGVIDWGAFVEDGTRYLGLDPIQSPFPLGRDKNQRATFSVNFTVQKELSAI